MGVGGSLRVASALLCKTCLKSGAINYSFPIGIPATMMVIKYFHGALPTAKATPPFPLGRVAGCIQLGDDSAQSPTGRAWPRGFLGFGRPDPLMFRIPGVQAGVCVGSPSPPNRTARLRVQLGGDDTHGPNSQQRWPEVPPSSGGRDQNPTHPPQIQQAGGGWSFVRELPLHTGDELGAQLVVVEPDTLRGVQFVPAGDRVCQGLWDNITLNLCSLTLPSWPTQLATPPPLQKSLSFKNNLST